MSWRHLSATGLALLLASCSESPADRDDVRVPLPPPGGTPRPTASPSAPTTPLPAAPQPQLGKTDSAKPEEPPPPPLFLVRPPEQGATAVPSGPDELVAEAERKARGNDLEEAIRVLEQALKVEPNHRKALQMLAIFTSERAADQDRPQSSPLYLRSAQAMRRLRDTHPDLDAQERTFLSIALYNEACTYAVENQPEKALDALAGALDAGLASVDLLANDPELDSIRKSPRFATLMEQAERSNRALARDKARKLAAATTPFPFHFALSDLEGKTVTLDAVEKDVTIVTLWGTWCAPCRREVPRYVKLLEKYRDRGLSIVGVNYERVDDRQVKATIREFVKKSKVPYTCLIGDDATRKQVPDFEGYPTTLFLDRSGTVRVKASGECSFLDLDAIVTLLLESGEKSSQ
jgi:thiol-disulfide isomerase/thioredoxin